MLGVHVICLELNSEIHQPFPQTFAGKYCITIIAILLYIPLFHVETWNLCCPPEMPHFMGCKTLPDREVVVLDVEPPK